MTQLLSCIKCDKPVSAAARACPHCKTPHFTQQPCRICGDRANPHKMVDLSQRGIIGKSGRYPISKLPTNRNLAPVSGFAHSDCLSKISPIYRSETPKINVTKSCPTCKHKVSQPLSDLLVHGDYYKPALCDKCGEQVDVNLSNASHRPCHYCGIMLDIHDQSAAVPIALGMDPDAPDAYSHLHCYQRFTDRKVNNPLASLVLLALLGLLIAVLLGAV